MSGREVRCQVGCRTRAQGQKAMSRSLFKGNLHLGPPVVPFFPFFGEGSLTKIDYRKKGTLILTSPLHNPDMVVF